MLLPYVLALGNDHDKKMSCIALQFCYINFVSWITYDCSVYAGVSIKTGVGSRFEKSNKLYQQRAPALVQLQKALNSDFQHSGD